jgi:hypothetical protein
MTFLLKVLVSQRTAIGWYVLAAVTPGLARCPTSTCGALTRRREMAVSQVGLCDPSAVRQT